MAITGVLQKQKQDYRGEGERGHGEMVTITKGSLQLYYYGRR